ncbi:MAG: hypothetical protein HY815_31310, partial [Candidatus Riflebacteria bacterium]|nr:hypothetical protein [Candidatus Riflebacteria bacterium]
MIARVAPVPVRSLVVSRPSLRTDRLEKLRATRNRACPAAPVLGSIAALLWAATVVHGGPVARHAEQVRLEPDGSARVEVRSSVPEGAGRTFVVPAIAAHVTGVAVKSGGARASARTVDGSTFVDVDRGGSTAPEVELTYGASGLFEPG